MAQEPHELKFPNTPPPLPVRSPLRDRPLYERQQTIPGLSARSFTPSPTSQNVGSSFSEAGQEAAMARSSRDSLSERCTLWEFLMSEPSSTADSPTDRSIEVGTLSPSSSMYNHRVIKTEGQTVRDEEESKEAVLLRSDYDIETSARGLRWSASSSEYSQAVERGQEQAVGEHEDSKLDTDLHKDCNEEASETSSTISSYDRGRLSSYQQNLVDDKNAAQNRQVKSDMASETDISFDRHRERLPLPQNNVEVDNDARTEAWLARGLASPKSSGNLSLFPPVSPKSGNREYGTSSVLFTPPNSPVSPLNNGRDAYGNWIDSNTMHSPKARPALQKEQSVPHLRGGWGRLGSLWGGDEKGEKQNHTHHLVVGEGSQSQHRGRSQTVPYVSRSQTAPDMRSQAASNSSTAFTPRHRPKLELQTGSSIRTGSNDAGGAQKRPPGPPRNDDYDDLSAIFNKYFGLVSSPMSPASPDTRSPASPTTSSLRPPTIGNLNRNKYVTPDVQETGGPRSSMRGSANAPRPTKGPSNASRSPTKRMHKISNDRSTHRDQQYPTHRPQYLNELRYTSPEPRPPGRNLHIEAPPARQPPAPPEPANFSNQQPDDNTDNRSIVTHSDQKSINIANLLPLDKEIFSSGVYTSHLSRVRAVKERKARESAQARWLAERERERIVLKKRDEERKRRLAPLVAHQAERAEQHSMVDTMGTVISENTTISPSDSVSNRIPYRPGPPRRAPPRRAPHRQAMETLVEQEDHDSGHPSTGFAQRHLATGVQALHNRLADAEPSTHPTKPAKENMNSLEMGLHITGKVVRFLLAAPSDPKLKTYSMRDPPRDVSPAGGARLAVISGSRAVTTAQPEINNTAASSIPTPPRETLWSTLSRKKRRNRDTTKAKTPFPRIEHTTLSGTTAVNSSATSHIPFPPTQRHRHTHTHRGIPAPRRPAPSVGESTIPEPHHQHYYPHLRRDVDKTPYAPSEAPTAWPEADERGDVKIARQDGVLRLRGGSGGEEGDAGGGDGEEEEQVEIMSRFSTDSSDREEEGRRRVVEEKATVFMGGGLGWVG